MNYFLFQIAVAVLYLGYIVIAFGVQPSISDSFRALENWDAANQGSAMDITLTPIGSTTGQIVATFTTLVPSLLFIYFAAFSPNTE